MQPPGPRDPTGASPGEGPGDAPPVRRGGVQSLGRAFVILESIAEAGGVVSLSELGARTGLPMPTIHRLVRTLVDLGYVRQEPSRRYSLGPRLIGLGEATRRRLTDWSLPHLEPVVRLTGESTNLATLDGDAVVYIGHLMPESNSMRMFTELGSRVAAHSTAVGKAILGSWPQEQVRELLARTGMRAATPHTITSPDRLVEELQQVRSRGYALDDEEQEVGVRCVAVAVPHDRHHLAVSVSGPLSRMGEEQIQAALTPLRQAAAAIGDELQERW